MAKQPSKSNQSKLLSQKSRVQSARPQSRSRFAPEYGVMLELLRERTRQANVTQEMIAGRLGKTQSHVSMCLNKEREISFVDLWKWCDAIEVSFGDFARDVEQAIKDTSC